MNATLLARDAYGDSTRAIRTPKSVEYDAFSRITSAMKKAETFVQKVEAMDLNRRLWTILAADVAGKDNGLPIALRAEIFALAEFTDKHTSKVLRHEAEIDVLIEINATIMGGLRRQGPAA